MTMEANKNRAFAETNYTNNISSQTFTYEDRYELIADSISEENGRTILPLNTNITFNFDILNVGSQTATAVPIDFPAYFTPQNGRPVFGSMGGFVVQSLPAHKRSRGNFIVSFQKSSTAMVGIRIDKDNTKNDLIRSNNEKYQTFQVGQKVNPPTGDDKIDIDFSKSVDSGKQIMPLYDQSLENTWRGLDPNLSLKLFQDSGCGLCSIAMVLTYMNDPTTPADLLTRGAANNSPYIADWSKTSKLYSFKRTALLDEADLRTQLAGDIYDSIVKEHTPVIYYYKRTYTHFVVISGYEFNLEKTLIGSNTYDPNYDSNPYGLSHFRIMDPYKGQWNTLQQIHDESTFSNSVSLQFVQPK